MKHEQSGQPPEVWRDVAADPEITARERRIADCLKTLNESWSEDTANTLRELQRQNARAVLERCGVAPEDIVTGGATMSRPQIARVGFVHGGKRHILTIDREHTEVMAWDDSIGKDGGWRVSSAYALCRTEGYHPDDDQLPDMLKEYVGRTLQTVPHIQDGSFNQRYGFLSFAVDSPRVSWALPVVMGVTALPIEEGLRITDPAERASFKPRLAWVDDTPKVPDASTPSIVAPAPGTLVAQGEAPMTWRLDRQGTLQDRRPLETDPTTQALMHLMDTMR